MELVLQKSPEFAIHQRCEDKGMTPLHHVSVIFLVGNARRLISGGANVNAKDDSDWASLLFCANGAQTTKTDHADRKKSVIKLLLEAGANVNNLVNRFGQYRTPLQSAIELNHIEACFPMDVVANYTRNEELARSFQSSDAYPIYASQLKKKFDAVFARQETVEQTIEVLGETLLFPEP
ncbi:hypothetical protein TSAR_015595, partial [Trichomalopsis sarcophagae]